MLFYEDIAKIFDRSATLDKGLIVSINTVFIALKEKKSFVKSFFLDISRQEKTFLVNFNYLNYSLIINLINSIVKADIAQIFISS